jgi:hypothetical protein
MLDDSPDPLTLDDNPDLLAIIRERLELGAARYGHGLRAEDDTTQWGTKEDSWVEMGLEEILDMTIYIACAMLRVRKYEAEARQALKDARIKRQQAQTMRDEAFDEIQKGGGSWLARWFKKRQS